MSRLVTAATQLLKLADELEAQAEAKTAFVCAGCGHVNTLGGINAAIRKYASEQTEPFDLQNNLVTVGDSCKCPSCGGGVMKYMPTAESEKFYVVMADEGPDPIGAMPPSEETSVHPEEAPETELPSTEAPETELPSTEAPETEEGVSVEEGMPTKSPEDGKRDEGEDKGEEDTPEVAVNQEKLALYLG